MIVSTYPPRRCGIGDYTADFAYALAQSHDVVLSVITYRDAMPQGVTSDDTVGADRIQLLRVLDERTPSRKLAAALDRIKPDIVHFQSGTFLHNASLNKSIASVRGAALVTTVHDTPTSFRLFYTIPALREVYRRSRHLITHSTGVSCKLADFHGAKKERLVQLPMGVDTQKYRPDADTSPLNQRFNLAGQRVILYFGFLRHGKGLEVLLAAWARIQREYPEVILVIAGGVPTRPMRYSLLLREETNYLPSLRQLAQSFHIEDRVLFTDYIPREFEAGLFALAELVVLPYTSDPSQSYPLRKALSAGRPVIATRFPGFLEVVNDRQDGLLVAPADADALARSLQFLLDHPSEARAMGGLGRRRAESSFDWSVIVEEVFRRCYCSHC